MKNSVYLTISMIACLLSAETLASLSITRSVEREYEQIVNPSAEAPSPFQPPAPPAAAPEATPGEDEAVDLGALDSGGGDSSSGGDGSSQGHGGSASPTFKVYFDFMLYLRPNAGDLSFDSFHNLMLFEIMPSADLTFTFEVRQVPRYFELDYRLSERLKIRIGKIWIPFDQMDPHNIYGGRTNVSKLTQGSATFLPDIWADLGVGLKYLVTDSAALSVEADAYVINGFRSSGTDPTGEPGDYPSFNTPGLGPDNNRNKALGGRVHATIAGIFGLGSSIYWGRYNDQGDSPPKYITAIAFDGSARLGPFELRAGIAGMTVDVEETVALEEIETTFTRGGFYGEVGYRFGAGQRWKLMARGGNVQLDDRVLADTDMQIVGAHLLHRMGPFELGLEHSRDLTVRSSKTNYTFTALRLVIGL